MERAYREVIGLTGPLVDRLADRHGQRTVVLVFSLVNALAITALVAGALSGLPDLTGRGSSTPPWE
jgi:hypothetical protein